MSKGCVLDLRLDDEQGTSAHDYSRYGNDGALNGCKWVEHGLEFNGTSDFVNCGNNESLNITDAITLSAWIKVNNLVDNYNGIISKRNGWGINQIPYDLHQYGNTIRFLIYGATAQVAVSPVALVVGEWSYVVAVYGVGNMIAYLNCEAGATSPRTAALPITTNAVKIGMAGVSAIHFDGLIDQPRIHNFALSAAEIYDYYESTKHRYK